MCSFLATGNVAHANTSQDLPYLCRVTTRGKNKLSGTVTITDIYVFTVLSYSYVLTYVCTLYRVHKPKNRISRFFLRPLQCVGCAEVFLKPP